MNLHSPIYVVAAILGLTIGTIILAAPAVADLIGRRRTHRAALLWSKVACAVHFLRSFDERDTTLVYRTLVLTERPGYGIGDNPSAVPHLQVVLDFLTARHVYSSNETHVDAALTALEQMSSAPQSVTA